MRVLVGTSGYAFKEWKGPFYPADLPDDELLGFYASRFPAVEINNTFYRLPKESVLRNWAAQVPQTFTFAIKANQRITHHARLKPEAAEVVAHLIRTVAVLDKRLGPILFQLPPNFKKDIDRLRGFLDLLPSDRRFTIEFRHESWFDGDAEEELRARGVALCVSEQAGMSSPMRATTTWGYLRLQRLDYDASMLAEWAGRIAEQPWKEAYVFFKHGHTAGSGPLAVDAFLKVLRG